jgi:DNA-binding MarR family transcriptional regulator
VPPDPQQTAADLRLAVGRLVRRVRRETSVLPPARMAVLGRLDRDGPLTIADLAAAERVSHQSMTRLVASLREANLVRPAPPPADDRRRKPFALAAAGRAALDAQRTHRSSWLATAIATELTAAEQRTLAAAIPLLDRLTAFEEAAERAR